MSKENLISKSEDAKECWTFYERIIIVEVTINLNFTFTLNYVTKFKKSQQNI